jgi:hypothetical protein
MNRAISATYDQEHNTSRLQFVDDRGLTTTPYYMRGALSWPTKVQSVNVAVPGYALIAGQEIAKDHTVKRMVIFEEYPFWSLSSVYNLEKKEYTDGLLGWLNTMWKRYRCGNYYCAGDESTHFLYSRMLHKEKFLAFRPVFIHCPKATEEPSYCDNIIIRESKLDRWFMVEPEGSETMNQLEQGGTDELKRYALTAARALFCGFEQSPWRLPSGYGKEPQLVWYR